MDNMKASELRIGNYVVEPKSGDKNPFQIFSTYSEIKNDKINGLPIPLMKPIPLTEEWLLRLGFKMHEGNNFYRYWINSDFELTYRPISEAIIFCFTPRRTDHMTGLEVKYVHQLQNLYFALTGEELILNGN